MAKTEMVNVLLHGIFGYNFGPDYIDAYAPAVCHHINKVSASRDLGHAVPLPRADFELTGVIAGSQFLPDESKSPLVTLPKNTVIDEFGKRHSMIRLPYPKNVKSISPIDAYYVKSIFAGRDAPGLNSVVPFPSMHIFSYERAIDTQLVLIPTDEQIAIRGGATATAINLDQLKSDASDGYTNAHIWCTLPPNMPDTPSMPSEEGHLRRGFAALIDLFPTLEITIEIPDEYSPAADRPEVLPPGVISCDVDPGRPKCTAATIVYGHVNCHYANIMTVSQP